ncbi:hypothetical protein C4N9_14635 [Pararhodobacter marinus]|uniref:Uncharacterized protein n=1 Tax=Pararhodobacter marinus TaxID=2184063 RepID=A0A2U2C754_9RHOB|nr:hypothetical protein [Pararhodobacter marinus]PWE27681.1 hypothetical protein C4N9_14635 [Pararhodobacter marinus]
MYRLKPGIKQDPLRRWRLPDRIFFGHGACHILAGVYLHDAPLPGFRAERIIPGDGKPGNHVYVTDGTIAFDFHGYSDREALLTHHVRGWRRVSGPEWRCTVESVRFDLLDTLALNARKMRGPDQYWGDAVVRARAFLARFDHAACAERARQRGGTARE